MPLRGTKTIKAGVLGWPVNHSLSPRLHGYWLQSESMKGDGEFGFGNDLIGNKAVGIFGDREHPRGFARAMP